MDILTAGRSWKPVAAAAVAGPLLLASVPSAAGDVKMKIYADTMTTTKDFLVP